MSEELVARRYARALYQVCLEKGMLDVAEKDLNYFTLILKTNDDLYRLLLSPRISSVEKKSILQRIFTDSLSLETMNFISLLVDKKRESLFDEISDVFSKIILENSNIVVANVITAFPLSISEQEELKASISKISGKTIILEMEEDPSIIGGLIVKVEDKVYDGSLTSHLKRIEQEMSGTL